MGLGYSRQDPVRNIEDLTLQHHLINYISKSFCIRSLVSRQRRRMLISGFDLDMSYITDRLLAMSFPAERIRAMYRNPLWQVKFVLDVVHEEHYKIYNLCIEENYDPINFHGRVETYPFDDNHVPPLEMIKLFCESVYSWHSSHAKHIAVVHCMAGKGRTGLMVCAYLVYCGMAKDDALQLYAQRRTTNNQGIFHPRLSKSVCSPSHVVLGDDTYKIPCVVYVVIGKTPHSGEQKDVCLINLENVSIPSQRRYVGYWANVLSFPRGVGNGPPTVSLPEPCSRELRRIRLYDTVNTDSVFFVVSELQEKPGELYRPAVEVSRSCCREIKKGYNRTTSLRYYLSFRAANEEAEKSQVVQMDTESPALYHKTCLDCCFRKPVQISGDVRITFYQKMNGGRLFYVCFNTSFIKNGLLQLKVGDLDKLGNKGKSICGAAFCLELLFGPANVKHSLSVSASPSDHHDCASSSTSDWS